ncbi:MAG: desulfoferrodoxin Dfx [Mollicutes bacterium]|nr:desulfoferrodoxin Dfx [Mollicutes bacterium]
MKLKKCFKCGLLLKEMGECSLKNCDVICCNEKMKNLKANTTEASFEKHIPNYEIVGDSIIVTVDHVMEEDHFIEWIACSHENKENFVYLNPGEKAEAEFEYAKGTVIYAYCNKHYLWSAEITD